MDALIPIACKDQSATVLLENFPPELLDVIAGYLAAQDFKSFRLCSNILAEVTRPLLALPLFTAVPRPDNGRLDPHRLHALSNVPECARRIRAISFDFGHTDAALAERLSAERLAGERLAAERIAALRPAGGGWPTDQEILTVCPALPLYGEPYSTVKPAEPFCIDTLLQALPRLTNLKHVRLTWVHGPWYGENRFWNTFMEHENFPAIQYAVLEKLSKLGVRLESLVLAPLSFSWSLPQKISHRKQLYGSLRSLKLSLDDEAWMYQPQKVYETMKMMPQLMHLLLELRNGQALDRPGASFLPITQFKRLETLVLVNVSFTLRSFGNFLKRHADTLKTLRVHEPVGNRDDGSDQPETTDWMDVLPMIRERCDKLTTARFSGRLIQPGPDGLYYFGPFGRERDRMVSMVELEKFLLGEGSSLFIQDPADPAPPATPYRVVDLKRLEDS